ncbi:50S ribosomal protein L30 [Melia azedarach]|uniref:50S ribosomal protein L30 n=1 Tax=Melia azedarach TaxID=155640 RepID=A0ACC1YMV6_MELAZ|nr:50S ribosomal protein L30 [Melia azedarach]
MNAFKTFEACVPIEWSPNLYTTLVRGMPGTRRLHRRTLEALHLRKCDCTVMRWSTPTVRGMLQQVKKGIRLAKRSWPTSELYIPLWSLVIRRDASSLLIIARVFVSEKFRFQVYEWEKIRESFRIGVFNHRGEERFNAIVVYS